LYLEVIRRAPELANAYQNLGIVYFMEHKYLDSATVLEKATKLAPQLAEARVMLGLAYYQLDEPSKAAVAFEGGLRLKPDDTNALLYLGKSQIHARDYRAAAKTLERLTALKPKDPDVLYNLSVAYLKLMLENFDRLSEVAPHSYQVWLLLAQDAEARGNDEAALKNYQQAAHAKPDASGVHYGLGSVYARLGKYDEAAKELNKELQLNPNDSLALWKLGELELRTNPKEARRELERAVNLNPRLPQAVLAYGRALARTGELEKATEQFQRVVRLAPDEDSVHYHLANAYRRLGRQQESQAEMARFEELAKKKSERTWEMARQIIEMSRSTQETSAEQEPGFAPSLDPAHP
jgi:tetratricopeptide (TPR) repeat protein